MLYDGTNRDRHKKMLYDRTNRDRQNTTPSVRTNKDKLITMLSECIIKGPDLNGGCCRDADFDRLCQRVSDIIQSETYGFWFAGKEGAIAQADSPPDQKLYPCRSESADWDSTDNLYLEGDNLTILKLLQEPYQGKIKMIYIDPPYNTGSDAFVYADDFTMDKERYEQYDSVQRKHAGWCCMMYPRLLLAENLLTEDGMIFLSIDDHEYANLKQICDEIFGEHNYFGTFIVNSAPNARDYGHIGKMHEYCLFYAKNSSRTKTNLLEDTKKQFRFTDEKGGFNIHPLYNSNEAFHSKNRPNLYYPFYLYPDEPAGLDGFYRIGLEKKERSVELYPPKSLKNGVQFVWRWGKEKAKQYLNEEIIGYQMGEGQYRIVQKMRHNKKMIRSLLTDKKYASRRGTKEAEELFGAKIFTFPKPLALLSDLCRTATDKEDVVLDFFSGSATTAHAVMLLNAKDGGRRKFIMVQRPEQTDVCSAAYKAGYRDICEIGKERIRRAARKIRQEEPGAAFDSGFRVYKLGEPLEQAPLDERRMGEEKKEGGA